MSHEQTKTNVIRLCSPYIYLGHRVTHDHSAYIHSTESPNTAKTCHSINGTLSIEQWRDGTNTSLPEDNKWMCRRHVYFGIDGTKLCRRWYNCLQWATARCLLRMLQVYYCECDAFFFWSTAGSCGWRKTTFWCRLFVALRSSLVCVCVCHAFMGFDAHPIHTLALFNLLSLTLRLQHIAPSLHLVLCAASKTKPKY